MVFPMRAQERPYIGFIYPAGGRQGATFQIRLGGQGLDEVNGVLVTGSGVRAKVVENYRRLNLEEMQLLNEQLIVLRREALSDSARADLMKAEAPTNGVETPVVVSAETEAGKSADAARKQMERIEQRTLEYVLAPASESLSSW